MSSQKPIELSNVSAELSPDGSILLPGVKLWLTPAEEKDYPYILSTWVRSYRRIQAGLKTFHKTDLTRKGISDNSYLAYYPKLAERLVPLAMVLRAETEDGTSGQACHGYCVGRGPEKVVQSGGHETYIPAVLHYAYLPPELRSLGLCKAMVTRLCGAGPIDVTSFWPKRWPEHFHYNPYRIYQ
jgi:hypothetical protein